MNNDWSIYANDILLDAIAKKDFAAILTSIQKGAHVNTICKNGMTPLGVAAEMGDICILKALIDIVSSRKVAQKSSDNKRPMKLRLGDCNKRRNIGYFVYNAEAEDLDNEGPTPEGMEDLEWDMEVTNDRDNNVASPSASESAMYKWYAKVLNQTASLLRSPENDITRQDCHGMNILHHAVRSDELEMVKFILEEFKEFNINERNTAGETPLHLATIKGNYETVKYLVEKGAEVNSFTTRRMTALHLAVFYNKIDIVKFLLNKGANPNVLDEVDRSPLSFAVDENNVEVVKILVKRGARLNQEDTNGVTPLLLAVDNDSTEVVQVLLDAGARVVHSQQLLHIATNNHNLEMIQILDKKGAIMNLRDDHGYTALMLACMRQNYQIVEYFLQRGMSANAINQINGDTALHLILLAIKTNPPLNQFVDLLVSYGADLDIATLQGGLYFHALVHGNIEGAKILIKHGIDVNKRDSHTDNNFLIISIKHGGTLDLVRLVVAAGFDFRKWRHSIVSHQFTNKFDPICQFVLERLHNPLSLKDLCRITIRAAFKKRHIPREVEKLPLPIVIKKFITLERLVI